MIPCIVNPVELNKMRRACKVTGDVLKMIEEYIRPGVTTRSEEHTSELQSHA